MIFQRATVCPSRRPLATAAGQLISRAELRRRRPALCSRAGLRGAVGRLSGARPRRMSISPAAAAAGAERNDVYVPPFTDERAHADVRRRSPVEMSPSSSCGGGIRMPYGSVAAPQPRRSRVLSLRVGHKPHARTDARMRSVPVERNAADEYEALAMLPAVRAPRRSPLFVVACSLDRAAGDDRSSEIYPHQYCIRADRSRDFCQQRSATNCAVRVNYRQRQCDGGGGGGGAAYARFDATLAGAVSSRLCGPAAAHFGADITSFPHEFGFIVSRNYISIAITIYLAYPFSVSC